MKASEIQQITEAIREHVIQALEFLYITAGVGDNRLELNEHTVEYDHGDYTIVAIDQEFCDATSGGIASKMVYYQQEGDNEQEDWQEMQHLPIEVLQKLLAVVEKVVECHYECALGDSKTFGLFFKKFPHVNSPEQ